MKWLACALLLAACGDSVHSSSNSDANLACPALTAPSWCKPGGLADIDLGGAWTATGTMTDDHCLTTSTMMDTSFQVTFTVAGCTFQDSGMRDDTIATVTSMQATTSGTQSVCVDSATNQLTYSSVHTQRCIPTSAQHDTIEFTGTLSR
jgi:hypothetical protein